MVQTTFKKNIIFSLLALFLFFAAAEGICRLFYHPNDSRGLRAKDMFTYDRDKLFTLKKNYEGSFARSPVRTNSFGHRDRETSVAKPEGTVRILTLGDSVTFGHGVEQAAIYPDRLEALLNAQEGRPRFEVINTAVPGNSPYQIYYDFERGLQFEPDVALIQFTLNDVIRPFVMLRRFGGVGLDHVDDLPYWHFWLSSRSAFFLFMWDMSERIQYGAPRSERHRAAIRKRYLESKRLVLEPEAPDLEAAWQESFKWFRKQDELCRLYQVTCVLVASPYRFQLSLPESEGHPQRRLRDFAAAHGWRYVDLLPVFRKAIQIKLTRRLGLSENTAYEELLNSHADLIEKEARRYFLDHDHYTPKGHAIVAKALKRVIQSL